MEGWQKEISDVKNQLLDRFQSINERFAQGAHGTALAIVESIKDKDNAKKSTHVTGASSSGVGLVESEANDLLTQKAILKASSRDILQDNNTILNEASLPQQESSRRIRASKESREYRRIVTRTLDPNTEIKQTKTSNKYRNEKTENEHPLDYLVNWI